MLDSSKQIVNQFRQLTNALKISLSVRGNTTLEDSWRLFAAQPAPTWPSWWRYTDRTEANQSIITSLPDLEQGSNLEYHHSGRMRDWKLEAPKRILPMKRVDFFYDARHYETIVLGGFLREAESADRTYDHYFNGRKTFSMLPPGVFDQKLTADMTFTAQVRLGVRNIVYFPLTHEERQAARRPPPFLPRPTPARPALLDTDLVREATDPIAHDLPEVGSDVTITLQSEVFKGTIIAVEGDLVTMDVFRTHGVGTLILTERVGRFVFGNPSAAHVSVRRGVQRALYKPFDNWLLSVLLGNNNASLPTYACPIVVRPWMQRFRPMNPAQLRIFSRAHRLSTAPTDRLLIFQGPHGTGKTRVIEITIMACLEDKFRFILAAETGSAVQVCA